MDLVPVSEDTKKWEVLYIRMGKGEKADINDKLLKPDPVEGIPPNLTGQDGQLQAPREAANVVPPAPEPQELPAVYKEATIMKARTSGRGGVRKRRRKRPIKRRKTGPRRSGTKRRKTTKRRRTTISKR